MHISQYRAYQAGIVYDFNAHSAACCSYCGLFPALRLIGNVKYFKGGDRASRGRYSTLG